MKKKYIVVIFMVLWFLSSCASISVRNGIQESLSLNARNLIRSEKIDAPNETAIAINYSLKQDNDANTFLIIHTSNEIQQYTGMNKIYYEQYTVRKANSSAYNNILSAEGIIGVIAILGGGISIINGLTNTDQNGKKLYTGIGVASIGIGVTAGIGWLIDYFNSQEGHRAEYKTEYSKVLINRTMTSIKEYQIDFTPQGKNQCYSYKSDTNGEITINLSTLGFVPKNKQIGRIEYGIGQQIDIEMPDSILNQNIVNQKMSDARKLIAQQQYEKGFQIIFDAVPYADFSEQSNEIKSYATDVLKSIAKDIGKNVMRPNYNGAMQMVSRFMNIISNAPPQIANESGWDESKEKIAKYCYQIADYYYKLKKYDEAIAANYNSLYLHNSTLASNQQEAIRSEMERAKRLIAEGKYWSLQEGEGFNTGTDTLFIDAPDVESAVNAFVSGAKKYHDLYQKLVNSPFAYGKESKIIFNLIGYEVSPSGEVLRIKTRTYVVGAFGEYVGGQKEWAYSQTDIEKKKGKWTRLLSANSLIVY